MTNLTIILPLFALCLSAISFYGYGIYAAIAFLQPAYAIDVDFHLPVTVLKPICGLDSDAFENLASFCQQDYPVYQIIFSVRDPLDSGIAIVKQIIEDFPEVDIELVVSDRVIGSNLKVSNLANAIVKAKHEIIFIADSDIRVGKDYLQRVIQPLQDENVGVVTCPYRSHTPSPHSPVSILEAIGITTEFQAGVLVNNQISGIQFAFGSTIAIRKKVLEAIGGFGAIADYLADDFQLGYLPAKLGYKVVLSDYVVEHVQPHTTLSDAIQRQNRWARCIRVSRPWGYLGLVFTYGTVNSLLLLIATAGSTLGWSIFVITWIMRLLMGWVVGVKILQDSVAEKFLWIVPMHDLLSFMIWCYGFVGRNIEWRGQQLKLIKGGKLVQVGH
jgi:ceramide glucosyltransferase